MNTIEIIKSFESKDLFNIIWSEKSEIIARVLLCMEYHKRPEIFDRLTLNAQISVIENIVNTKEISSQELKQIDELLTKQPSVSVYENGLAEGGIEAAVEILNFSHVDNFNQIIEVFEETKPELADEILKRMLVLEDIVMLDNDFLKKALSEVDNHDLAIALKDVDETVQEMKVFENITKEREKIIKEKMGELGPTLEKDVDEAKFKIANFIRKLWKAEKRKTK